MPRVDTRLALMRAAEQLFAQQGVDRVSLREIAVAAGQRNVSAATYHFGSKRELIEAILERHSIPIQEAWQAAFDRDPERKLELPRLVELIVRPMVAKIDDVDNGRCYLELCAELVASRSFPLMGMRVATTPTAHAAAKRVADFGPPLPPMFVAVRGTRLTGLLYGSIGDYLRFTGNGIDISRELFIADLVNVIVAAVEAKTPTEGSP